MKIGKQVYDGILPQEKQKTVFSAPVQDRIADEPADRALRQSAQDDQHKRGESKKADAEPVGQGILTVQRKKRDPKSKNDPEKYEQHDPPRFFFRRKFGIIQFPDKKSARRSQHKSPDPRVGAVIAPGDIACPSVAERHGQQQHDTENEKCPDREKPAFPFSHQSVQTEQEGPDHIKLKQDAQKPHMRKRRRVQNARKVVHVLNDLPEIIVSEHDAEKFRPDRFDHGRREKNAETDRKDQDEKQ